MTQSNLLDAIATIIPLIVLVAGAVFHFTITKANVTTLMDEVEEIKNLLNGRTPREGVTERLTLAENKLGDLKELLERQVLSNTELLRNLNSGNSALREQLARIETAIGTNTGKTVIERLAVIESQSENIQKKLEQLDRDKGHSASA